nr:antibiotic biosynthesis monooxygenase [Microbulbifer rhizosphaerae]
MVIQTRIAEEGAGSYVEWQRRVGEVLQSRPGFLGQEVLAPSPPAQADWIVVQRFEDLDHARDWMQSDELHRLLKEVAGLFAGHEDIFLVGDSLARHPPVSAIIYCRLGPEEEEAFLEWEERLFRAEMSFPGFVGHKLNQPIPGIQESWVAVVTFDTEANLQRWLDSPEREALLEQGRRYEGHVRIMSSNAGFGVWARDQEGAPAHSLLWVLKSNLLVLLVLYPVVYLWGYLAGQPLLDEKGAPAWLSLFIGNLVSTQVLGWFLVPWALKAFEPWLAPGRSTATEVVGWAVLLVLYGLSMAGFAWILRLPPLSLGS